MKNKKTIFAQAIDEIEKGKKGLNEGLPMGFERLVEYVPNLQKGTYYLIGGATGTGKSAFVDEAFIFNPFEYIIENGDINDFEVIYYSFEINKVTKILKAIARRVFLKYGVLVDINYILSRGKNRISDEIYKYILELREYFEVLESCMTIIDMSQPPKDIKKYIHNHAARNGELEISSKGEMYYHPNNPNKITEVILDHAGLTQEVEGKNTKQTIDELSQDFVPIRNIYQYTPVLIQQLTFESSSVNRMKGTTRKAPVLADFGDSKYTTRDANIVMALFNPAKLEMPDYKGYNIGIFKDRFRSLELLKNRDGAPDVSLGLKFIGEVGLFKELPKPTDIKAIDIEYKKLDNLNKLKPKKNE